MGLHPRPRSDDHVLLNFNKGPHETIVPERAAVEIHRLHDLDPLAKRHVDDSGREEQFEVRPRGKSYGNARAPATSVSPSLTPPLHSWLSEFSVKVPFLDPLRVQYRNP